MMECQSKLSHSKGDSHMRTTLLIALLLLLFNFCLHAAIDFVGDYRSHRIDGNTVFFDCTPAFVSVEFCTEDIVKVGLTFIWNPVEDSSYVVMHEAWPQVSFTIEDDDSTLHILSSTFDISCQKYPFRLSFCERSGHLLVQERSEGGLGWQSPHTYAFFSQSPEDHFYGLGMRAIDLDRKGRSFDTYNRHGSGDDEHATMGINIPFLCTTSGYGLYFDNTYPGNFDFGEESSEYWFYRSDGGQMVYYLIHGPDMKGILEKYTWLTGRQPLPPRWALGYLQSKYGYQNENEAKAMISTMRNKGIPIDAIILDLYWFGYPGDMGRFAWNLSNWPDPTGMVEEFREYGIKTILIEEPYVRDWTSNFSEGSSNGSFGTTPSGNTYIVNMWAGPAGLIDFTNPAARDWWWSKHEPFLDQGIAGWWTDLGEPETHPGDMVHHIGSAAKAHNILNLLWSRTLYEGYRSYSPDERVFLVTRSGYAGMQRYGTAPWSGDVACTFKGLRNQIPIMLGMSLSGVAYQNSDIGGFWGAPSGELYTRWIQFGAFCPIMRPHGVDHPTEPYGYGSEVEAICREYILLRYRLLPYIYTMAFKNTSRGLPLARPLVLEYPDDPQVVNLGREYLWGDDILVAPVTEEGATTKEVYLPEGQWIEYWTKEMFTRGSYIVQAPLDVLPLFVKNGAILLMGPEMDYSDQMPLDSLTLDMYPAGFSSTILYEDDGSSYAYESGDWDTTRFTCRVFSNETIVEIEPAVGGFSGRLSSRVYISQINRVFDAPDSVLVNDELAIHYFSSSEFSSATEGWWYDQIRHLVKVKVVASPDTYNRIEVFGTSFQYECEGRRGDVNGDGEIDVRDIVVMANHILGHTLLDGDALCRADCTGDGVINILDALSVSNIIIGIVPECPGNGLCRPKVTPELVELMTSLEPYFSVEDFERIMMLVTSEIELPWEYRLTQNVPNPFNPTTSIQYSVVSDQSLPLAVLKIYNVLGQEVKTLVNGVQGPGTYTVQWDGTDALGNEVSSGVYFYTFQAGEYKDVKKMLLLR
jgi:oligosaccharide 4-alpha-D-glucosyltransferase